MEEKKEDKTEKEQTNIIFKPKSFTDLNSSKVATLTKWIEVTWKELLEKVKLDEKNLHRKVGEEETCPICMCELYEDLEKKSPQEIEEITENQLSQKIPIDVVLMNKCTDHCFHKECLEMQMKDQDHIRCAVCS